MRYVSLEKQEEPVDMDQVYARMVEVNGRIEDAKAKHNAFLRELGMREV